MADDVEIKSSMTVSCNNISNAGVTSSKDMGEGINKDPARIFFLTKYIEYCKRGHVGKMHKIFTEQMVKRANHLLRFLELGYKKPTIDDFKNLELYKELQDNEKKDLETLISNENTYPNLFSLDYGAVHWENYAPATPLFLDSYSPVITSVDSSSVDKLTLEVKDKLTTLVKVEDGFYKKASSEDTDEDSTSGGSYGFISTKFRGFTIEEVSDDDDEDGTNYFPMLLPIDRLTEINVSCKFVAPDSISKAQMALLLREEDESNILEKCIEKDPFIENKCKRSYYHVNIARACQNRNLLDKNEEVEIKLSNQQTIKVTPVIDNAITEDDDRDITKSYKDIVEHYISQDTRLSGFTFRNVFDMNYHSQCHLYTMCNDELSYIENLSTEMNDCVVDHYTYTSEEGNVTIIKSCNLNDINKMYITYNDLLTITYNINDKGELPIDYSTVAENDVNSMICKFNPKFRLFARLTDSTDPFVPFEQLNLYPIEHNPDFIAFKDTKKYFFTSAIQVPLAFLKYNSFRLNAYMSLNPSYMKATSIYDSSQIMFSNYILYPPKYKKAKLTFIMPIDSSIKRYVDKKEDAIFQYGSLSREGLWVKKDGPSTSYLFDEICSSIANYTPKMDENPVDISGVKAGLCRENNNLTAIEEDKKKGKTGCELKGEHYRMWSPIITFVKPSRMAANPHGVFVIGTHSYPFSYKNKYDVGSIPASSDTWYVQRPSVSGLINPNDLSYGNGIQINIPINAHKNTSTVIKFPTFSGQKYLIQDNWTGDYKFSDTIPTDWEPNNPDSDLYFSKSDEEYIPFKYSFYREGTTDSKNKKIVSYVMNDKTYPFLEGSGIVEESIHIGYPYKIHKHVTHIIFEYSYDNEDDSSPNSYLINYTIAPAYERYGRKVFFNYKGIKDTRLDPYLTYTKAGGELKQTTANERTFIATGRYYDVIRAMLEKKYETALSKLDFDPLKYAFKYGNDIKYSPEDKYPLGKWTTGASTEPLIYNKRDKNGNKVEVTRVSKFTIKPAVFPFKDSLFYYAGGDQEIDPFASEDLYQAYDKDHWGGLGSAKRDGYSEGYLAVGRTLVNGETNPSAIVPNIYLLTGVNIWGKLITATLPDGRTEAVKFSWMTDGEKYYLFEYFLMFIEAQNYEELSKLKIKNVRKALQNNVFNDGLSCDISIPMTINQNSFFALEHWYHFKAEIKKVEIAEGEHISPLKTFGADKYGNDETPKRYTPPSEKYILTAYSDSSFSITEIKSKLRITVTAHDFKFTQYAQALLGDTDKGEYDGEWRGGRSSQNASFLADNYSEATFVPLNYGIVRYAPPYYRLQLAYQSIKFYNMPTTMDAEETPSIWKKIGYSILAVIVAVVAVVATLVTLGAALPATGPLTAMAIVGIVGATLSIAGAAVTCFATLADIWGWLPSDVIDILNKVGMGLGAVGAAFTATSAVANAVGTVAIVASSMGAAASFINVGVVAANMAIEINYKNEIEKLEEEAEDFQKALEVRLNTLDELTRILASNSSILPPQLTLAILGAKRIEDGVIEKPDAFFNRTKNIDQNLSRYLTMPFDTTENFVSMTLSLY